MTDTKELEDYWLGFCHRHEHGDCQIRGCFIANGWDGKTAPINVEPKCREKQTADALASMRAENERHERLYAELTKAVDDKANEIDRLRAENERLERLAYWDGPESPTWQSQALEEAFKRAELERECDRLRAQRDEAAYHVKMLLVGLGDSPSTGVRADARHFLNTFTTGEQKDG